MLFSARLHAASVRAVGVGLLTATVALAPGSPALAATTWHALVGSDTADHAIQGNAFFPGELTINTGDVVTWTVNSGEIHSVSFGPPPGHGFADALTRVTDSTGGGVDATYTGGTDWVNSGLLPSPPPAPGQPPITTYTVKFAVAPGDYQFVCLVHHTMKGTLHVEPVGQAVPHNQAFYNQQNIPQENQLLAQGRQVMAAGLAAALGTSRQAVTAGDGQVNVNQTAVSDASVAVLRFLPSAKVVHVNDTVTWTDLDPETPHTVSFGTDPPNGIAGEIFPGSNVSGSAVSGGHVNLNGPVTGAGQYVNSGFIGSNTDFPSTGKTFSATFLAPGTYNYHCLLHDDLGMTGTITVLPN